MSKVTVVEKLNFCSDGTSVFSENTLTGCIMVTLVDAAGGYFVISLQYIYLLKILSAVINISYIHVYSYMVQTSVFKTVEI